MVGDAGLTVLPEFTDIPRYLAHLAGLRAVVTARFHTAVMALVCGTTVVGVDTYGHKIAGGLATAGFGDGRASQDPTGPSRRRPPSPAAAAPDDASLAATRAARPGRPGNTCSRCVEGPGDRSVTPSLGSVGPPTIFARCPNPDSAGRSTGGRPGPPAFAASPTVLVTRRDLGRTTAGRVRGRLGPVRDRRRPGPSSTSSIASSPPTGGRSPSAAGYRYRTKAGWQFYRPLADLAAIRRDRGTDILGIGRRRSRHRVTMRRACRSTASSSC